MKLVLALAVLIAAAFVYLSFGPAVAGLLISAAVLLLFWLRAPAAPVAGGEADGGTLYRAIELTEHNR